MFPNFLITFREVLEMSLLVGIVLSYLNKTKQTKYNNVVYVGVGGGIIASVIGAVLFQKMTGGFAGRAEQNFEGITMLIGAGLLTSMIIWMSRQRQIAATIEQKVAAHAANDHHVGIFFLVFFAILREGVETVIFLSAATLVASGGRLVGALGGIVGAIFLGYLIFVAAVKVNIKKFFTSTSILLIFFAAGLVAHGVHELGEAAIIPPLVAELWNTNHLLNEGGAAGSLLKGLFGYNDNPSLMEVISYITYLAGAAWLFFPTAFRKKDNRAIVE
ncbi:MAG: FTR1 family protein [Candidatus Magasanikbacteria bacterium]|nr:FTR1 family protein [Candidatus Magasanikbacteria bacterium]